MNEETLETSGLSEMTRDQIANEIAGIDQIAKQNSYKYEKRLRGDFPDAKWERFIASQNEMFERRAALEAELESRDEEDDGIGDSQSETFDFSGMTAAEVKRSLSYRPRLDELRQACDWLGIAWDESMTRADLTALIDAAAEAESAE